MCMQALSQAAVADKEEWVSIMGRAVGGFERQLDLAAVLKGSSAVGVHYIDSVFTPCELLSA